MDITLVTGDIFEAIQNEGYCQTAQDSVHDVCLVHCISSDFALGAGIAVQFRTRFDMRQKLLEAYPEVQLTDDVIGKALLIDNVFNLVTKKHYYDKPTYESVRSSLEDMKEQCRAAAVKRLIMPRIASGLDRLNWNKVLEIIKSVFIDTDIRIVVYSLDPLPED